MIEAVNSVLASAPLIRQNADQQSGGALASNQVESVRTVTQAPYISPFISVDVNFDTAVILLRDAETGDTVRQIPSEGALEARRRQQSVEQSQPSSESPRQDISIQSEQSAEYTSDPVATPAPAPESPEVTTTQSTPISQAALSAFASGAQAASAGSTPSFATTA